MKARRKQNDERNKRQRMVTVVILPNEIFFLITIYIVLKFLLLS